MREMAILWRGRVPTASVSWRFYAERSIALPADLEPMRLKVWENAQRENPEIYDGRLLVLLNVQTTEGELRLETTEITFSRILTLQHCGMGLDRYTALGVQALILSRDGDHALIGRRSIRSLYCPGYWSTPGGMLEVQDVRGSFDSACMRETGEEVEVEVSKSRYAVALVKEVHGRLGSIILFTTKTQSAIDVNTAVAGNEEWEAHQLKWVSLEDVATLPKERSLEGVQFLGSEWRRMKSGEESVLL